jgi:hypothetical protein
MTIDEAEKMASEHVAAFDERAKFCAETGNFLHTSPADDLARFLLSVLPVVRAAEPWRAEIAVKPRPTNAEVTLAVAVDSMQIDVALAAEQCPTCLRRPSKSAGCPGCR